MAGSDARSPLLLGIIIFFIAAIAIMGAMRAFGLPHRKTNPRAQAPRAPRVATTAGK
jgi:methionine sulfoxide reductase heme-binding subunit